MVGAGVGAGLGADVGEELGADVGCGATKASAAPTNASSTIATRLMLAVRGNSRTWSEEALS